MVDKSINQYLRFCRKMCNWRLKHIMKYEIFARQKEVEFLVLPKSFWINIENRTCMDDVTVQTGDGQKRGSVKPYHCSTSARF